MAQQLRVFAGLEENPNLTTVQMDMILIPTFQMEKLRLGKR